MKIGEKVQCWDESNHTCIGWGTIVRIAYTVAGETSKGFILKKKGIPLIQLESGKTIWGDRCSYIEEKKACEIGVRLFRDIHKRPMG